MFRNKAFNIVLIVLIVLVLLGIVYFVAQKTILAPKSGAPSAPTAKQLASTQYDVGQMTTNLQGDNLIQASFTLQADSSGAKNELDERKTQVKDIINSVLHTTTEAQIQQADGYVKLKQRLESALNQVLQTGKVTDVYIANIVVQ